jgi:hypothetical protein
MERFSKEKVYSFLSMFVLISLVFTSTASSAPLPDAEAAVDILREGDEGITGCANLDVIFIVDQSASMSGEPIRYASDPEEQRIFAIHSMIDLLVGLAFDQCPGTHHRIGVISFGGAYRVDLPLTDIAPLTAEDAASLRDPNGPLKRSVTAANLGQTNPYPAFLEAYEMFRRASDVGEGPRKRVIIFLTDGIPDCDECDPDPVIEARNIRDRVNGMFRFDSDLLGLERCLMDLRSRYEDADIPPEETNACIAAHPIPDSAYENSVYIWTVFLMPPSYQMGGYTNAYWNVMQYYRDISESHAGSAIELSARSRQAVPSTFRRILSALAGVRPVLLICGNGYIAVNPYLRQARITVYKLDPELTITLSYTDLRGNTYSITGGHTETPSAFELDPDNGYYSFGPNETYILLYPYPGLWQLTADNCDGVDAYYESVDMNAGSYEMNLPRSLPQYDLPPFYDSSEPYYLTYEMRDQSNGRIVPQADWPRMAVNVTATVTDPANRTQTYSLVWSESAGLFTANVPGNPQPLQLPLPGTYSVRLVGTTYIHQGDPSPVSGNMNEVFDTPYTVFDQVTTFSVYEVRPFTFEILEPAAGETIHDVHATISRGWPLAVETIPVRVRMIDRSGNPLDPADYFASPGEAFTAQVTGGGEISRIIYLVPVAGSLGEFRGDVPDFEVLGPHTITVNVNTSALLPATRPDHRSMTVDFSRVDTLFHKPSFYPGLLVTILALIVIDIVYNIAIRTNKVTGSLLFRDGTATLAEFNLSSGKNWRLIGHRELKRYPQLMLTRIKVVNESNASRKRKEKRSAEDDFLGEHLLPAEDSQAIRVFCKTSDGRKFDLVLYPDMATGYGDETIAQMVYEPLKQS